MIWHFMYEGVSRRKEDQIYYELSGPCCCKKSMKSARNSIKFCVAATWENRRRSFRGYCSWIAKALCDSLRDLGIGEPAVSNNQKNLRFWIDGNIQIYVFFLSVSLLHWLLCNIVSFKFSIHTYLHLFKNL